MHTTELTNQIAGVIQQLQLVHQQLLDLPLDEVSPVELPSDALERLSQRICLYCHRKIEGRIVRGDHDACSKKVKTEIKNGSISEVEAIRRGLIAPAQTGGTKMKRTPGDDILDSYKTTRRLNVAPEAGTVEPDDAAAKAAGAQKRSRAKKNG